MGITIKTVESQIKVGIAIKIAEWQIKDGSRK